MAQNKTEQKIIKQELKISDDFSKIVLQNLPDIVTAVNRDYQIEYLNRSILDYLQETVMGRSVLEFLDPENAQITKKAIDLVFKTGDPQYIENQIYSENKRDYSWLSNRMSAIITDGQIRQVLIISSDITNQKKTEETLRNQNTTMKNQTLVFKETNEFLVKERKHDQQNLEKTVAKLNLFIENSPDLIIQIDSSGKILFLNYTTTGAPPESFIGKNIQDLMPPLEKKRLWKIINNVFQSGKNNSYEVSIPLEDGVNHIFFSRVEPVKTSDGLVDSVLIFSSDITEKKKNENSLKQSEEKFRTIVNNIHEYIYDIEFCDEKLISAYHSPKSSEITGYLPSEFMDNQNLWYEMVHPEDKNIINNFIKKLKKGKRPQTIEHRIRHKDGSVKWVSNTCISQRNNEKSFRREIGFISDITERKNMENALNEYLAMQKIILNTVPAGIVYTKGSKFIWMNEFYEKLFGYGPGEMKGLPVDTIYPDTDEHKEEKEKAFSVMKDNELFTNQRLLKKKDGSVFWGGFSAQMVDVNDPSKGVISFVEDISKRFELFLALHESEEKYKALFESATEGIIVADRESKKFQFVNSAICEMLGYSKKELTQMGVSDLIPEKYRKEMIKRFENKEKTNTNVPYLKKNGEIIYVNISRGDFTLKGKKLRVGFFTDITERKKDEKRLKESLKEKEILLSEVHHRVKNNLSIISSLLEMQAMQTNDNHIINALKDGQNRINSMSMIYETLYLSENLSLINMKKYLLKLADAVTQSAALMHNINLEIEAENILLEVKYASPLGMVINELITNSFKYAFPDNRKGEIRIKLQKIKNNIILNYSDNGVGLPKDLDLKNPKSLGLSLVKMIIEDQLEGAVVLSRKPGACYTIKFEEETTN